MSRLLDFSDTVATQTNIKMNGREMLAKALAMNTVQRCGFCSGKLQHGYPIFFGGDIKFCSGFCRTSSEAAIKENLKQSGIAFWVFFIQQIQKQTAQHGPPTWLTTTLPKLTITTMCSGKERWQSRFFGMHAVRWYIVRLPICISFLSSMNTFWNWVSLACLLPQSKTWASRLRVCWLVWCL